MYAALSYLPVLCGFQRRDDVEVVVLHES